MSGIGDLAIAQPLLMLVILAVLAAAAGWMTERDRPAIALGLRRSGYLGMLVAGLLLIGQLAQEAERSDAALLMGSRPKLSIEGGETVIPIASDGHFWADALVNGSEVRFLIDTGATMTGISQDAAEAAGIEPDPGEMPLQLNTANGVITATVGRAGELSFGSITARNLAVAVPRDLDDDTNVIGMNLLSQLESWRVEEDKLILVPKG
jgi:aspartyl protease family protein